MIEPSQTTETLYDRLMRLRPETLSTRAWTINAGVSSGFFDHLAAGGAPREGELPKVLAVVGMTVGAFEGRKRPTSPASPPTLRVMPRAPRPDAQIGPADSSPDAPASPDGSGTPSADEPGEPAAGSPRFAGATAEAIERWLEARRQAMAAGLDTSGSEGASLVTELARLALDLEPGRS
jgi:hypothetical protein